MFVFENNSILLIVSFHTSQFSDRTSVKYLYLFWRYFRFPGWSLIENKKLTQMSFFVCAPILPLVTRVLEYLESVVRLFNHKYSLENKHVSNHWSKWDLFMSTTETWVSLSYFNKDTILKINQICQYCRLNCFFSLFITFGSRVCLNFCYFNLL